MRAAVRNCRVDSRQITRLSSRSVRRADTTAALTDLPEGDDEPKCRVGRDRVVGNRPVALVGRDDEQPPAADLHPDQPLVPTPDDLPHAELEVDRLLTERAFELGAGIE